MQICTCNERHSHKTTGFTINKSFKVDPTRTLTIRDRFVKEMDKRFNQLKKVIRESIVDKDCFGLQGPKALELTSTMPRQFDFSRSDKKIDAFMDWLQQQEREGILEIKYRPGGLRGLEEAWTDVYIQTAYQKSVLQAREKLRKQGINVPPTVIAPETIAMGGFAAAFNQPIHVDRVALLYSRTFSQLKGITAEMDNRISSLLAQGLAEGRNPRELARLLNSAIELPPVTVEIPGRKPWKITAKQRARMLARTEIIAAHAEGVLTEYELYGIEGVEVEAEWITAGYNVCPDCSSLEGRVFSIEEARGMIPRHPNCRCSWLPVTKETKSRN